MIHERIKKRLVRDRVMTSVTLSIPKDVLDDLDDMALHLSFSGPQALIRSYISEGMRRDEEKVYFAPAGESRKYPKPKEPEPRIVKGALVDASEPLRAVG